MMNSLPIIDSFGRVHTSLRVSVTDRCNIRCFYCMPENVEFLPRAELLSLEELTRVVRVSASMGVSKVRLTGGEPLVRKNLNHLIESIVAIEGITDVALTTNGILLEAQAEGLKRAGLHRLNVSLDTINPEIFERISRRQGLDQVMKGIQRSKEVGFSNIRMNAVSIKGLTESEIIPLALFARKEGLHLRFIEFMPLDADKKWDLDQVLTGAEVLKILDRELGTLVPAFPTYPNQPATEYQYADGHGTVGFINSVSEPFCKDCDRMRITAEGKFRNCLFSSEEWDLRTPLRSGESDETIESLIREAISNKKAGHGMDSDKFLPPARPMYQIGG